MTICNNYVKSCHRALSAIIYIYMYFVCTIALNSHICMLTYMALCMTIGMLLLQ